MLTSRRLSAAAARGARGSVYKVELTAAQAALMRRAVKNLYARLFAWLVGQANDSFVLGQAAAAACSRTTGGSSDDSDKRIGRAQSMPSAVTNASLGAIHT